MISAFPMNEPKIAIYVAMEKPHSLIQYGGTIIGPILNNIISDVGIYLNIDKQESDLKFEYTWMDVKNYEVENYIGKCIAFIHRINDDDDKLVVVPEGKEYTDEQIKALTEFQERYFESEIIR